jgi:hypothetical protein
VLQLPLQQWRRGLHHHRLLAAAWQREQHRRCCCECGLHRPLLSSLVPGCCEGWGGGTPTE